MRFKELITEDDLKTPSVKEKQTLEIVVEPLDGGFRAHIKTVNGKPYGTSSFHPKEFMGSGKTMSDALFDLSRKLQK